MTQIKGNVTAALDDVLLTIGGVVLSMGMGVFGDLPDAAAEAIASALGHAVADVQRRASEGAFEWKGDEAVGVQSGT